MIRKSWPQFMKYASMPYPVESVCNVKKDSRAQAFVFKSFFNDDSYTVHLVYCRVILSETKLMCWHLVFLCSGGFKMLKYQFLKQLWHDQQ
jgi:hypothetical protein